MEERRGGGGAGRWRVAGGKRAGQRSGAEAITEREQD